MRTKLHSYLHFLSDNISIPSYVNLSGIKQVLPFYHSVSDTPLPHFSELNYYRTKKRFLEDLDFFQAHYQSIGIESVGKCVSPSFHLTFDDGMSEVYSVVYHVLKERSIPATFFINSDFIDNNKLFFKHKLSILIYECKKSFHVNNKIAEFLSCDISQTFANLKSQTDDQKIEQLSKIAGICFNDYLQTYKPYLTKKQVLEIQDSGFTIANHGKAHVNLNSLSLLNQVHEIESVNNFLSNEFSIDDFYFCFPFGDSEIKNELFDTMYKDLNIIKSFGVSGFKKDYYENHFHRVLMEYNDYSAEEIIKFEYFYYILKSLVNKNKISR